MIDLTHVITNEMSVFPGDPAVETMVYLDYEKDACRVSRWIMGSHTGTHMDAPSHFIPGGFSLGDYGVERYIGRGVVADLSHVAADGLINKKELTMALDACHKGDFLVIYTGWDRYWHQPLYDRHPHISIDAAEEIVARGISLVAIDGPDIEKALDENYPVHQLLLQNDCLIVENLCNLHLIPSAEGWFTFLPLSVEHADGSPIRAVYQSCD